MLQSLKEYLNDGSLITTAIVLAITLAVTVFTAVQVILIHISNKRFLKSEKVLNLYISRIGGILFILVFAVIFIFNIFLIEELLHRLLLSLLLLEIIGFLIYLQNAKSGITAEGVYVSGRFYEWFMIHDYYIDKPHKRIIFSSNIKGGLTLKGLTEPLKYDAEKESYLENFLEKQNSKFLKRIIIR